MSQCTSKGIVIKISTQQIKRKNNYQDGTLARIQEFGTDSGKEIPMIGGSSSLSWIEI